MTIDCVADSVHSDFGAL